VSDYLNQTANGDAGGVDYRANPRALHPGSRAAKELDVRVTAAKRLDQAGCVQVAGCLPGRD
jgi:hypothetical protein